MPRKKNPISNYLGNIKSASLNKLEILIKKHPDCINRATSKGTTPLSMAVKFQDYEVIELLLINGANPNIYVNNSCMLYLIIHRYYYTRNRLKRNRHEILKEKKLYHYYELLLKYGADPNGTYGNEKNPIIKQVIGGNFDDLLLLLIKYKVDVNKLDCDGRSPIYTAVTGGHYKMTQILLENGVNVNGYSDLRGYLENYNNSIKNPLLNSDINGIINYYTEKYDIIKLLLENGAYIPKGIIYNYSRRFFSFHLESNSLIALLLQYGADPYDYDIDAAKQYLEDNKTYPLERNRVRRLIDPSPELTEYINKYRKISRLHTMCVRVVKMYNLVEKLDYEFPPLLLQIEEDIAPECVEYTKFSDDPYLY